VYTVSTTFMYIGFLYRRYKPVWVLASMGLLHTLLSSSFVFDPRTPRIVRPIFTQPSHLQAESTSLPFALGLREVSFLHEDFSSIPVRCRGHLSLPNLTNITISVYKCTEELRYEKSTLYHTSVITLLFSKFYLEDIN
jgi:hypothetical protein